jgi:GNAT superfamily N-acetyltransferase
LVLEPAATLERAQWDYFWIPEETVVHERAGLAYLSSPHDLPHLNAVTRTELGNDELDSAVSEVTNAHRSVQSRWLVYSRIDREPLRRALAASGYVPHTEFDARAVQVDAHIPQPVASCRVVRVSDMQGLQHFHAVANAAFEQERAYTMDQLAAQLRQCESPLSRVQRFVAYRGECAVSCGGLNAFDALGLGLLWAGCTIPDARGKGSYSALVTARIDWARRRGLPLVGLYARTTTSSPITAKQGFVKYDTMTHWERVP